MSETETTIEQGKSLLAEATNYLTRYEKFDVTNDAQYAQAGEVAKAAKNRAKEIEELRTSITKPLNDSLRKINNLFKPAAEKYAKVDKIAGQAMLNYQNAKRQEAIRLEAEQRKLQEKERGKLERQAEKAEEKGDQTTADALRSVSDNMPTAPIVNAAPPKVQGMTSRDNWTYRIVNYKALVQHLIKTPKYHYLLKVDEVELRKLVRAMKDNTDIKHIDVKNDPSMVKTK
jgi:hypothetical protein